MTYDRDDDDQRPGMILSLTLNPTRLSLHAMGLPLLDSDPAKDQCRVRLGLLRWLMVIAPAVLITGSAPTRSKCEHY
jgi:hypothetical protein